VLQCKSVCRLHMTSHRKDGQQSLPIYLSPPPPQQHTTRV